MNLLRFCGTVKRRRMLKMAVLAKPANRAFIIDENKSEEFLNSKKNNALDEILKKAKLAKIKRE